MLGEQSVDRSFGSKAAPNKIGDAVFGILPYAASTSVIGVEGNPDSGGRELVRGRLAGALVCDQFIAETLAFGQRVHARALGGADVNEHIGPAILRLDEAEALGRIEPLNGPNFHFVALPRKRGRLAP